MLGCRDHFLRDARNGLRAGVVIIVRDARARNGDVYFSLVVTC